MIGLKKLLLYFMLILTCPSMAQDYLTHSTRELKTIFQHTTPDTARLNLLHEIGKSYLFRQGRLASNLDSAVVIFRWAISLSDSMKWSSPRYENLCRLAECYLLKGDYETARKHFLHVINDYHQQQDKEREARTWLRYADKLNSTGDQSVQNKDMESMLYRALQLFQEAKNNSRVSDALYSLAHYHLRGGLADKALDELKQAFDYGKDQLDRPRTLKYNALLSSIHQYRGQYDKGLTVCMAMVKEPIENEYWSLWFDAQVASLYQDLDQMDKSIEWLQGAIAKIKASKEPIGNPELLYLSTCALTQAYIAQKEFNEALKLLNDISQNFPPKGNLGEGYLARAKGLYYHAIRDDRQAERYFTKMLDCGVKVNEQVFVSEAEHEAGKFYFDRREYPKALSHLKRSLTPVTGFSTLGRIAEDYLLLSRAEYSVGNCDAAMKYFQQHKALSDSIFDISKSRQIEELGVQYETEKKERDITLLNKQSELQKSRLDNEILIRNAAVGASVLLLFLIAALYKGYQRNRKNNLLLRKQQEEINDKNTSLQHHIRDKDGLLAEQERLLNEKEWLLKEVHHRVKNNLQVVISLLNSQSRYVDNDAALLAIQNSQNRVFAMSLIHQKLYQSSSLACIHMPFFIQELCTHLRDCFETGDRIQFNIDVDEIELDVVQSVPVGLILNEAITNAIKYAFPGQRKGLVSVAMKCDEGGRITMTVCDDGVGLAKNFNIQEQNSLGLSLIHGLSKQLEGKLEIGNHQGVSMTIHFYVKKMILA